VTGDQLPDELAGWPAWTPGEAQLGELELITSGVFAPLTGYLTAADLAAVAARGELADGTPWPVQVTLTVPASAVPDDADHLVLQDAEASPLAVLAIAERSPADLAGALLRLAGPVTALRAPEHGPFRALRRAPADVRRELAGVPVLALATRRPLTERHIGQLKYLARQLKARILLLPLVVGQAAVVGRPEALVRAVKAAARQLPDRTLVVPVPLAARASAAEELRAQVVIAASYGATHLLTEGAGPVRSEESNFEKFGVTVVSPGEWAYDPGSDVWRPLGLIEPGAEQGELSDGELGALLDSGASVPSWLVPAAVAAELRRARPPRSARGLVVFCTGLSGSGKSTIARDLRDALLERGDRTVSLLDGDLVRRLLSAGLTYSREDRDLNIARIGYVATEVARHGGIAICAPIAPYAAARAAVRSMVGEVGDFLLVYVSTPLDVCEQRDRKGWYAKARAGVIGSFTGISDPYEEPADADLVIDTSGVSRQEAVDAVLAMLTRGGWLAPYPEGTTPRNPPAAP
jgi:sulfate adenylyltransferase